MTEILAADNHSIHTKSGRWRLIYNERPLAEASDKGFRYSGRFGTTRRLPDGGIIQRQDVVQVVLGWQVTDESWHLGLILAPPLASQRKSRWCEIVHWPDPDITVFQDLAQSSGQQLAQAIGVPFYVIPPQTTATPAAPARNLPELPLRFGDWQMTAIAADKRQTTMQGQAAAPRYLIKRTSSWSFRRFTKMMWYIFWGTVYLALSLATLFGQIALPTTGTLVPDPEILPYLGLATSVGLYVAASYVFSTMIFSVNRILVDGARGFVSGWNGKRRLWMVNKTEMQSLYVSEVAKKREQAPATEYGELNFHLGGGKFRYVVSQEQPEDNSKTPQPELMFPRNENIRELTREVVHTDMQAAGMYISEAFSNLPIWYDMRMR